MDLSYRREPEYLKFEQFYGADIIGIDGDQGAGKTTDLARQFQQALNGKVFDMDAYLELSSDKRPYLEKLDLHKAKQDIDLNSNTPKIIVGVLLLDVLAALGIKQDILVFAKLIKNGIWPYQHLIGRNNQLTRCDLTREIAAYYNRQKPWERAALTTTLFLSTNYR